MTLHFFEFRIDYGPGFRVYFSIQGQKILLLLVGGDKRTQSKDIENAKSKSSSKPAVKYDDWMMERLKKNKKEAFEYLKTSSEENADFPPAFLLSPRRVSPAFDMSMEDIAKEAGISTATIYKALGEKGNPTIDTLASILKTMSFKLTLTPIEKAS